MQEAAMKHPLHPPGTAKFEDHHQVVIGCSPAWQYPQPTHPLTRSATPMAFFLVLLLLNSGNLLAVAPTQGLGLRLAAPSTPVAQDACEHGPSPHAATTHGAAVQATADLDIVDPPSIDQGAAKQQAVEQETAKQAAATPKISWSDLPPAEAGGVWLFSGPELKHWRVVEQSYFDKHGPVTWQDEVLTLTAGSPGTGVVADFTVPRNGYEIHFQARRTAGDDFFCGLTFPFDDQQATLILGGWGGGTVGISNVNNFSAIENASTRNFAFENDRWYDFRLRVTPIEIELWVDDKSLFLLDTEEKTFSIWWEQKPIAPLGFASWRTTGQFRRVRLVAVDPPNNESASEAERSDKFSDLAPLLGRYRQDP